MKVFAAGRWYSLSESVFLQVGWRKFHYGDGGWLGVLGPKTLSGCSASLKPGPYPTSQGGHTQGCHRAPAALGSSSRRPHLSVALNGSNYEIGVTHLNFPAHRIPGGINLPCLELLSLQGSEWSFSLQILPQTLFTDRPLTNRKYLATDYNDIHLLTSRGVTMAVALASQTGHPAVTVPPCLLATCSSKAKGSFVLCKAGPRTHSDFHHGRERSTQPHRKWK